MMPGVRFLREDGTARFVVAKWVPPLCHVEAVDTVDELAIAGGRAHGIVLAAPHNNLVRGLLEEHRGLLVCVLNPAFNAAALSCAADRLFLPSAGAADASVGATVARFVHALSPVLPALEPSVAAYARQLGLSAAEARGLALAVAGHPPEATATRLGLSVRTVEGQLASVRQKSGGKTMQRVLVDLLWFVAHSGARAPPPTPTTDRE
jgi:DNA-binding CsgD family transcriptional regulator